jgi:hypothetical protein
MSTPAAAAPSPDFDEAFQTLHAQVFTPSYFAKLASLGRHPKNEAEARSYLAIGTDLLALHHEEQVKLAAADARNLDSALAELRSYTGKSPAPTEDQYVKRAAADYATDPAIVAAALALNPLAARVR